MFYLKFIIFGLIIINFLGCSYKNDMKSEDRNKRYEIEDIVYETISSLKVSEKYYNKYDQCVSKEQKNNNMIMFLNNLVETEILRNNIKLKTDYNDVEYIIKCDYNIADGKLLVHFKYINIKTKELLSKSFFIEKIKKEKVNLAETEFRLLRIIEEKEVKK